MAGELQNVSLIKRPVELSDPSELYTRAVTCATELALQHELLPMTPSSSPTRRQVASLAGQLVEPLVRSKLYHANVDAWNAAYDAEDWKNVVIKVLSNPGDGNCGECVRFMHGVLRKNFGEALEVVSNELEIWPETALQNLRIRDHQFFVVHAREVDGRVTPLIVDFSWLQWIEPGRIAPLLLASPSVFVGTKEELWEIFKRNYTALGGRWGKTASDRQKIFAALYDMKPSVCHVSSRDHSTNQQPDREGPIPAWIRLFVR